MELTWHECRLETRDNGRGVTGILTNWAFPSENLVFWLGNSWENLEVKMWVNLLGCNVTRVWVTLVFVLLNSNCS